MKKRNAEVLTMVNGVENWIPKLPAKLSQSLADKVLDPSKMFMNFGPANDLDIISRINMEVIKLDNIEMSCEDFLNKDFEDRKFSTIIANPPWIKVGIQFIDKMVDLLEDEGRLVCVMGYNAFTDVKGKPGSFYDLQKRGSFNYINNTKGMSSKDTFNGRGDWCWFVFDNHYENTETTIVNRLDESFSYILSGSEYIIPQIHNEDDYFDWSSPCKVNLGAPGVGRVYKEDKLVIIPRTNGVQLEELAAGEPSRINASMIPLKYMDSTTSFFEDLDWVKLYGNSKCGDILRCPPFKVSN